MLKCGRFSELRADGGNPEPPVMSRVVHQPAEPVDIWPGTRKSRLTSESETRKRTVEKPQPGNNWLPRAGANLGAVADRAPLPIVSGAANQANQVSPHTPRWSGPPDPMYPKWLEYLAHFHPILHRVITRHEQRQTARFPDGGRAQN